MILDCAPSPIRMAILVAYGSSPSFIDQIAANVKLLLKVVSAICIVGTAAIAHGCRESVLTVYGGAEHYPKNCAKRTG